MKHTISLNCVFHELGPQGEWLSTYTDSLTCQVISRPTWGVYKPVSVCLWEHRPVYGWMNSEVNGNRWLNTPAARGTEKVEPGS